MRHTTVNQESPSWGTPSSWWKISFSYQEVIGKLITSHTLYISLIWFDLPHFLWPRPLCWAFSWGTFVANAFFVDRFLEFFLMEGLFCRPFLWRFFLVSSLFCRPISWRTFFGERLVLQTVFMENVFWWKACFVERFHGECFLVKGFFVVRLFSWIFVFLVCRPFPFFGDRLVL